MAAFCQINWQRYMATLKVMQIPVVKVTVTPVSMIGDADDAPIQVLLRGPEVASLYEMADSIMAIMKGI